MFCKSFFILIDAHSSADSGRTLRWNILSFRSSYLCTFEPSWAWNGISHLNWSKSSHWTFSMTIWPALFGVTFRITSMVLLPCSLYSLLSVRKSYYAFWSSLYRQTRWTFEIRISVASGLRIMKRTVIGLPAKTFLSFLRVTSSFSSEFKASCTLSSVS